ncbi:MAG TPA: hypothetical protein VK899_02350 [Gemmatimonadales bacterium]|nr:hypothetical protein [Gemmatimonadales bacterium]
MRTAPVLDQITFDRVLRTMEKARHEGIPLPEALNRAGLLWTPDREHQVRLATMRFILEEMSGWTPTQFLRRRSKALTSMTPVDMYMSIHEWLQEHLAHATTEARQP